MAEFITLINHAGESGELTELPDRLAAAAGTNITIDSFHLTFGRYDAVLIIDAPDEPSAAMFLLTTLGQRAIRTETMTALDEGQVRAIADGLLS